MSRKLEGIEEQRNALKDMLLEILGASSTAITTDLRRRANRILDACEGGEDDELTPRFRVSHRRQSSRRKQR